MSTSSGQGKRSDIDDLKEAIRSGADMLTLADNHPAWWRYTNAVKLYRGMLQSRVDAGERIIRDVRVLWGATGTGKTRWVREYMVAQGWSVYKPSYNNGNKMSFETYDGQVRSCFSMFQHLLFNFCFYLTGLHIFGRVRVGESYPSRTEAFVRGCAGDAAGSRQLCDRPSQGGDDHLPAESSSLDATERSDAVAAGGSVCSVSPVQVGLELSADAVVSGDRWRSTSYGDLLFFRGGESDDFAISEPLGLIPTFPVITSMDWPEPTSFVCGRCGVSGYCDWSLFADGFRQFDLFSWCHICVVQSVIAGFATGVSEGVGTEPHSGCGVAGPESPIGVSVREFEIERDFWSDSDEEGEAPSDC
jgi:hypothetical protein